MYGHAERARLAADRAVAETLELLVRLPRLDEDQLSFIEEFSPELLHPAKPLAASPPPARRSA